MALGAQAATTESSHRWFVAASRIAESDGRSEEAIRLLDQAEQVYQPGFFADVRPIPAVRARLCVTMGNLSEAADWARERGVDAEDDASYLREFEHLTLVRLLIAQYRADRQGGTLDRVAGLLGRLLTAAEASGRARSVLESRMLRASCKTPRESDHKPWRGWLEHSPRHPNQVGMFAFSSPRAPR